MATTTCSTTVGVFATRGAAEQAVAELKRAKYRDDQIGLVGKNASGNTVKEDGSGAMETHAGDGAAIGAAAGAISGAAVGAGLLMGVIPVIGPVLAIGTLGTILLNAAGGAAIAGVAGALIGWGVPDEDAQYYEGQVQSGKFLVTVECGQGDDARDILSRQGGYDRRNAPRM